MSYFNLRKHEEQDPEPVDEDPVEVEEAAEDADQDAAPTDPPVSWPAALWQAVSGPSVWLDARTNTQVVIIGHLFLIWACAEYGPWATAGITAAYLAAAATFLPAEHKERIAARAEGWDEARGAALDEVAANTAPAPEEREPADPHTVLVGWLDDLTRGRPGIHLDELHQTLTQHPQLAGLKRTEMRAWLDRHGVAVERTLRVGRVAGRSGVARATVEALLKASPPLLESGVQNPPVHASDQHGSPAESGAERGGERAA